MKFANATEAFDFWYTELSEQGLNQPSRAGVVRGEVLNAVTVIENASRGIVFSKIRNMPMRYAVGELLWYLSGSNKLSDIAPYSKFWEDISDDGETLNSAYGHRIGVFYGFDQWNFVRELLIQDPMSRQAVIHIKDASDVHTKDVPCTLSIQYFIRDNLLHSTVYMRSNDLWKGFPYDVFAFTSLQVLMAMELGVGVGSYTHISASLHLYEKDMEVK